MQAQPLIAVHDVTASCRWYQQLLACGSDQVGPDSARLIHHGQIMLQLQRWDRQEFPHLGNPEVTPYGNGVLLWFQVDDFDAALERSSELDAAILEPPYININADQRECWLRDPDGYVVVLASRAGDLGAL